MVSRSPICRGQVRTLRTGLIRPGPSLTPGDGEQRGSGGEPLGQRPRLLEGMRESQKRGAGPGWDVQVATVRFGRRLGSGRACPGAAAEEDRDHPGTPPEDPIHDQASVGEGCMQARGS